MNIFLTGMRYLLLLVTASFSITAQAALDLLIFPEARTQRIKNNTSNTTDTNASIDFFGTAHYGQFRFLAEVSIFEDNPEIERLQIGYEFTPSSSAWLGRMHNLLGYWNTQYNHGTYLQTSISRPQIAEFEHNGGLFPSHTTGLLFETSQEITQEGSIDFSFVAGSSPELRADNEVQLDGLVLHTRELFNPGKGNHKLNLAARMIYSPQTMRNNQLGVFASQIEIAVTDPNVNSINLTVAGLLAYWEFQSLNIYSSLFYIRDRVESNNTKNTGSFSSGYVQLDYLIEENWTLFGRLEDTFNATADPYLALMQNFSPTTQVAGIRWDVTHNQALKLEASEKELAGETITTLILNWSAVFP